jgi:DNA primase
MDIQYRAIDGMQKVCCPVHPESHPSCTVHLGEGWFRCFHDADCKGDGYALVMAVEGCTFPQAKERVKEMTGHEPGQREPERPKPRSVFRDGSGFRPKTRGRVLR